MADVPIYQDSRILVSNDRVVVRKYNFPFCNAKTIAYSEIDQVEISNNLRFYELKTQGAAFSNICSCTGYRIGCTPKEAVEAGEAIVGAMQQYKPGFRLIRNIT